MSHLRHLPPAAVHKTAADQVLLTDAIRIGDDRFLVGALWPGDHQLYYPDASGAADPTFVVESVRQAAIHLSHRFYDTAASGQAFLLSRFDVGFTSPGLPHPAGDTLPAMLDISCTHTTTRSGRADMTMKADVLVDGVRHAHASVRWSILPTRLYSALRVRGRPAPTTDSRLLATLPAVGLPAHAVGRRHERDVLLAEAPGLADDSWLLTMDRTHPVLFDHESDHVPGMVLLEAIRQAAHASGTRSASPARGSGLSHLVADFHAFCELDTPVLITVSRSPDSDMDFIATAEQEGRTAVQAGLTVHGRPEAAPC